MFLTSIGKGLQDRIENRVNAFWQGLVSISAYRKIPGRGNAWFTAITLNDVGASIYSLCGWIRSTKYEIEFQLGGIESKYQRTLRTAPSTRSRFEDGISDQFFLSWSESLTDRVDHDANTMLRGMLAAAEMSPQSRDLAHSLFQRLSQGLSRATVRRNHRTSQ